MKTDELREKYLDFFASKGCVRRPTDVLVPRGDKTVLFTPAGMNQFKNQFLGIGPLEFTKATTCQKCIRTGDIDNVGFTAYHHTFFEMLGNFSFGDYFKKEAIHWAWEFLTTKKWLGLDPSRLRITVYLDDDEAYNIWHDEVKVSASAISRENEGENFWPANSPSQGPDGVCGPCSEIYYLPEGSKKDVEIWNLVFTQFNRVGDPPNNLQPLPKKNIDTGMGLERCASVMQGVHSNFEIDILAPLCQAAGDIVGVKYSYDSPQGRPLRRIADHVRACTFCLHEGVAPGPEKQGYIVRLLLRRAFLEGYLLGQHEPFLYKLVPAVIEAMKVPYPELAQTAQQCITGIRGEEEQFLSTVDKGVRKFDSFLEEARKKGSKTISGDAAWELHSTDGFLIELSQALAAKNEFQVDRPRFDVLQAEHSIVSKKGGFDGSVMAIGPLSELQRSLKPTEFLGYDLTDSPAKVMGLIEEEKVVSSVQQDDDALIGVVLDKTPFYAEAGGQVGDTGYLKGPGFEFEVTNTKKDNGLYIHIGILAKGKIDLHASVTATVNSARRAGIKRAHSATHLLHHALQTVLGNHAMQRGSLVQEDILRFDFTQPKPITDDQLTKIEDIINEKVALGAPVTCEVMDQEAAKKAGATALFGEKYPDRVRVVTMGDFSKELCGGTHLTSTGQVGFCKVVSEESVSKGVRRVTAYTGPKAMRKIREDENLLKEVALAVKAPRLEDAPQRVNAMLEELRELKRELQKQSSQSAANLVETLFAEATKVGDTSVIAALVENFDTDAIRSLIDQLRRKTQSAAVLIGSVSDGKVILIAGLSQDLIAKKVNASDWVKAAAKAVGGGGGGRPDLAQAGGKTPENLPQAIADGKSYILGKL
ncbi:MAG: alanyl-tRNA synthetase [Planctomycetaceae bacterium]|nr:alanyl-tRNA synthetase [Planctomycetaceae bacterium]